ncbi:hypothetical protein LTR94_031089, partial [Friedmanniomyces endolithicus]
RVAAAAAPVRRCPPTKSGRWHERLHTGSVGRIPAREPRLRAQARHRGRAADPARGRAQRRRHRRRLRGDPRRRRLPAVRDRRLPERIRRARTLVRRLLRRDGQRERHPCHGRTAHRRRGCAVEPRRRRRHAGAGGDGGGLPCVWCSHRRRSQQPAHRPRTAVGRHHRPRAPPADQLRCATWPAPGRRDRPARTLPGAV